MEEGGLCPGAPAPKPPGPPGAEAPKRSGPGPCAYVPFLGWFRSKVHDLNPLKIVSRAEGLAHSFRVGGLVSRQGARSKSIDKRVPRIGGAHRAAHRGSVLGIERRTEEGGGRGRERQHSPESSNL